MVILQLNRCKACRLNVTHLYVKTFLNEKEEGSPLEQTRYDTIALESLTIPIKFTRLIIIYDHLINVLEAFLLYIPIHMCRVVEP